MKGTHAYATSLVFEDHFNGTLITLPDGSKKSYPDPKYWAFTFWPGTKWPESYGDGTHWLSANGECQIYLSSLQSVFEKTVIPEKYRYDPFLIASDGLHVKASVLTPEQQSAYHIGGFRHFASGMLLSRFSFMYGTIRMVTKLPSARGSWPAFWLLPSNHTWPPEIDIFEAMAWGKHRQQIHSGIHTIEAEKGSFNSWFDTKTDMSKDFHEYSLNWTPDNLTMFLDGKMVWQKPTPASMHQPMVLLANLAVGGKWPYNELDVLPLDSLDAERLSKGADMIEADYPAEMIIRSIAITSP